MPDHPGLRAPPKSLQGPAHAPDVALAAHREYLIERSKYAAAVLFAPPDAGPALLDEPEPAARMLRTWSMAGLERLFADLFQVGAACGCGMLFGSRQQKGHMACVAAAKERIPGGEKRCQLVG